MIPLVPIVPMISPKGTFGPNRKLIPMIPWVQMISIICSIGNNGAIESNGTMGIISLLDSMVLIVFYSISPLIGIIGTNCTIGTNC